MLTATLGSKYTDDRDATMSRFQLRLAAVAYRGVPANQRDCTLLSDMVGDRRRSLPAARCSEFPARHFAMSAVEAAGGKSQR